MKYNHLVLGGTFDLLHLGHQSFLNKAFKLGVFVTIGLTMDKFNTSRGKPSFEDQNLRLRNLKAFLTKQNYIQRSKIVFINDIFGTTLDDPTLEAIIVTSKTKKAVNLINKKRIKRNLNKLDIITVPFTKDKNGRIISSSKIRKGEINTLGQSYKSMLLKIAGKKLSKSIRRQLKKPLGPLISSSPVALAEGDPFITIGDVTTANFIDKGGLPNLAIIDLKVGRIVIPRSEATWESNLNEIATGPTDPRNDGVVKVKNPPGQISRSLVLAIARALKRLPTTHYPLPTILVAGEEDLTTIPAILLSTLGTIVYYGQPNQGLVEVKVDLEIKDYLVKLLKL